MIMASSIITASSACLAESFKASNRNNYINANIILPQCQADTLHVTLERKGGEKNSTQKITVKYKAEQLIRGKSTYTGKGLKYDDQEMRPILQGEAELPFAGDRNGNATAVLSLSLSNHPYGFFYLTVSMADKAGQNVLTDRTPYIVAPNLPALAPGNITGFDVFGNSWDFGAIGAAGSKPAQERREVLERYGFSWAHMRAIWGQYPDMEKRLDSLDLWVDAALSQKAKIIMAIADGPPTMYRQDDNAAWDMQLYKAWARTLMERYKGKVSVWDAWNEPDSKYYAIKERRDMEALKIVHALRDEICPEAKVIVSPHAGAGFNYLESILKQGAGKYLDGVGLHPYRGLAPEIPESDAYTGNSAGTATYTTAIQDLNALLEKYGVPKDIYVTEMNYALNLLTSYDDNDQANFMIRMQILSRTMDNIKCFMHHAPFNGRLAITYYPNFVAQLSNAKCSGKIDAGDDEIHAYAFLKKDGGEVVPIWSSNKEKSINISGLSAKPVIVDVYGNRIDFSYDDKERAAQAIKISQAPIYLNCGGQSNIKIKSTALMEVKCPEQIVKGEKAWVEITFKQVGELFVQSPVLTVQSPQRIDKTGLRKIEISAPERSEEDSYPLVFELKDKAGKTLDLKGFEIPVKAAVSEKNKQLNIVFQDDFEKSGVGNFKILKSSQNEVGVMDHGASKVLRVVQKGVDHPAELSASFAPAQYGVLEFGFYMPKAGQSFAFALNNRLKITLSAAGDVNATDRKFELGAWNSMKCFFNAPEGYYVLFLNHVNIGRYNFTAGGEAFGEFIISSGTEFSEAPGGIMVDMVKITKIEPSWLGEEPLKWTVCGPFANKIDPVTGQRPFEKDYLAPRGGEADVYPYPGMDVEYEGKTLTFSPFITAAEHRKPDYFDFFKAKHLGLMPNQPDLITYAAAYVLSAEEQERVFVLGSDDYYHLWVNGNLVGKINGWPFGHGCPAEGTERYNVALRKGLNLILMKVDQGEGDYGFILRINK